MAFSVNKKKTQCTGGYDHIIESPIHRILLNVIIYRTSQDIARGRG